jgi:hypothetical protein
MKIILLPQPPLFKVSVLHQVQTKWDKTNMIEGIRLPVLTFSQGQTLKHVREFMHVVGNVQAVS